MASPSSKVSPPLGSLGQASQSKTDTEAASAFYKSSEGSNSSDNARIIVPQTSASFSLLPDDLLEAAKILASPSSILASKSSTLDQEASPSSTEESLTITKQAGKKDDEPYDDGSRKIMTSPSSSSISTKTFGVFDGPTTPSRAATAASACHLNQPQARTIGNDDDECDNESVNSSPTSVMLLHPASNSAATHLLLENAPSIAYIKRSERKRQRVASQQTRTSVDSVAAAPCVAVRPQPQLPAAAINLEESSSKKRSKSVRFDRDPSNGKIRKTYYSMQFPPLYQDDIQAPWLSKSQLRQSRIDAHSIVQDLKRQDCNILYLQQVTRLVQDMSGCQQDKSLNVSKPVPVQLLNVG